MSTGNRLPGEGKRYRILEIGPITVMAVLPEYWK
jgi:hypothetical protein